VGSAADKGGEVDASVSERRLDDSSTSPFGYGSSSTFFLLVRNHFSMYLLQHRIQLRLPTIISAPTLV
jgi:hypothetical protein